MQFLVFATAGWAPARAPDGDASHKAFRGYFSLEVLLTPRMASSHSAKCYGQLGGGFMQI
jgi:hypothetical protein